MCSIISLGTWVLLNLVLIWKLHSFSSSCFLLCLKLVSGRLIIKYLHEIFSQMFERWQSIIMALPWLGVRCKQGPSFGTLFKRTLGRGPEYHEPWHVPWIDNWQETVPETAGKMHGDSITQWFDWQPVLKSGYEHPHTHPLPPMITEISYNKW